VIDMAVMKSEEFVKELTNGERNFASPGNYNHVDLSGQRFPYELVRELQTYFKQIIADPAKLAELQKDGIVIDGMNLRGAEAKELWLPYARGSGVDMRDAVIPNASMPKLYLVRPQMQGLVAVRADLDGIIVIDGEMSDKTDISYADTSEGVFRNTIMSGVVARFGKSSNCQFPLSRAEGTDFRERTFDGSNISDFNMYGADLRHASMVGVKTQGGTNVGRARMKGTALRETEGFELIDGLDTAVWELPHNLGAKEREFMESRGYLKEPKKK
jgi:uncharacterized protein YjbI with pentapeptide repeats